jgi:inosose dehydratase
LSLVDRIAGAPITWGVCEVPGWGVQLPAERVLEEMAALGLRATELGPDGFLPADPGRLRDLLAGHGLRLVAGFVPVPLHDERTLASSLARAGAAADLLASAGADVLVLAAAMATAGYESAAELDDDQWATLVLGVDRVVELAAGRGLEVAVHPHHGTAIERAEHVERFLDQSTASLCLDTGHLMVGGADPAQVAKMAAGRVAHVHLKDVDASKAERVRSGRSGYLDAVRAGMYRPLGQGDVDVEGVVRTLEDSGYGGWYVLEQDTVLASAPSNGAGPALAAAESLAFLRALATGPDDGSPAEAVGGERAAHGAASQKEEEGR